MMRRMGRGALTLSLFALMLGACAGSEAETTTTLADEAPSSTAGSDVEAAITIENFAFNGVRNVEAGTTVVATNQDGVTHTWTSADDVWNSGGLSSGDSFEFTFTDPGEYDYFCSIHPQMTGTITVEG